MKRIKVLEITDIVKEGDEKNSRQFNSFSFCQGYEVTEDYFVVQKDRKSINLDSPAVKMSMEYGAVVRTVFFVKCDNLKEHFLYDNEFYFFDNQHDYLDDGVIFVDKRDAELFSATQGIYDLFVRYNDPNDKEAFQEIMLRLVGRQDVA